MEKKDFLELNLQSQARVFSEMADNVSKKFPRDIKKQALSLGKAFDKMTNRKRGAR